MKAIHKNVHALPAVMIILTILITLPFGPYEDLTGGDFDSPYRGTEKFFQEYEFIVEGDSLDIFTFASFPILPERTFKFISETSYNASETTSLCQRNVNLRC
jgi:hypothetical protein